MNRFICFAKSALLVVFTAHLPRTDLPVSEYLQATEEIQVEMSPVFDSSQAKPQMRKDILIMHVRLQQLGCMKQYFKSCDLNASLIPPGAGWH